MAGSPTILSMSWIVLTLMWGKLDDDTFMSGKFSFSRLMLMFEARGDLSLPPN